MSEENVFQPQSSGQTDPRPVRVFGVGNAGCAILDEIRRFEPEQAMLIPVHTDPVALARRNFESKLPLESQHIRGLGTGGDPTVAQLAVENSLEKLEPFMDGAQVAILIAGLGGGTGSGAGLALAREARQRGILTLAFVATPFDCEGDRRMNQARGALAEFRKACDGVVCLPNQNVFEMLDANTSIRSVHTYLNRLHAQGISSLVKIFSGQRGLMNLTPADLSMALKGRRCECRFAHAEATGEERVRDAVSRLLEHPMLGSDEFLSTAQEFALTITGGSDLTMAQIQNAKDLLGREFENATITLGAYESGEMEGSFALTLIAVRKEQRGRKPEHVRGNAHDQESHDLVIDGEPGQRPPSQILPPPPELTPELRAKLKGGKASKGGKGSPLQQGTFDEALLSKGRFDQTEPNIRGGEDLDVPTYIRKRIFLN